MDIDYLKGHGVIETPSFMDNDSIHYLTIMGSNAYGVSTEDSDIDLYGFCIPPKDVIFPYSRNYIPGFDTSPHTFGQWTDNDIKYNGSVYDISIYNITKYFYLSINNNPNMIESLFTPDSCVVKLSEIGSHVRGNRRTFLNKDSYKNSCGFIYSNLKKIRNNHHNKNVNKLMYHCVRIALNIEEILASGDLNIDTRSDILNEVRSGAWDLDRFNEWIESRLSHIEHLKDNKNEIPHEADRLQIRKLLIECLEMNFGSLDKFLGYLSEEPV